MTALTETQREMLTEEERGWLPCGYPTNELLYRLAKERESAKNAFLELLEQQSEALKRKNEMIEEAGAACNRNADSLDEAVRQRDEARAEIKGLKELAFNYLDFTPHCGDDNKCFTCGEQWYPNKCEVTCLARLLFQASKEAGSTSVVWLELCDQLEEAQMKLKVVREQWRQWQPTAGGPTWWTPEFEAVVAEKKKASK